MVDYFKDLISKLITGEDENDFKSCAEIKKESESNKPCTANIDKASKLKVEAEVMKDLVSHRPARVPIKNIFNNVKMDPLDIGVHDGNISFHKLKKENEVKSIIKFKPSKNRGCTTHDTKSVELHCDFKRLYNKLAPKDSHRCRSVVTTLAKDGNVPTIIDLKSHQYLGSNLTSLNKTQNNSKSKSLTLI